MKGRATPMLAAAVLACGLGACGSSSKKSSSKPSAAAIDAKSQATGDIPDNQAFLTFRDAEGYSISYPEGWARRGAGAEVTFQDKANVIRITVTHGAAPTARSVRAALLALGRTDPTLKAGTPRPVALKHGPAIQVSYTRQGPADPVTGKRPTLIADRYVFARGGRVATVDLATAKGVDNVDAYRLISRSFTWR